MKKKIIFGIVIIFISIIFYIFTFNNSLNVTIEIDDNINENVYVVTNNSKLEVYDSKYQDYVEDSIDKLKNKSDYSFEEPLMIINPYGTNMTGLYIYFNTLDEVAIEYTISVDDSSIPDYTNMLVGDYTLKHEGQIIGLIQGKKNILTLRQLDKNLKVIGETKLIIDLPYYDKDAIEKVDVIEYGKIDEITDGLFFPTNTKNDSTGSSLALGLYDNNGILRAQFLGESGVIGNSIQFTENNEMIFTVIQKGKKVIKVNKYGKIEDFYENVKHTHEYMYKEGKLYFTNSTTDEIYSYDLESHTLKSLFSFRKLMPDVYNKSMTYYYSVFPENRGKSIDGDDWLHCNSIDFINENDVVVSCRERSSIFYIEDLFNNPKLKYIIGPPEIWDGTNFEKYLLDKDGNFTEQLGQHTIRVQRDKSLNENQYYLYMFNNNYAKSYTVPNFNWVDSYHDSGIRGDSRGANSKYYKYLVDDNKKTYELVQEFDVAYASARGGVHKYNNNIIVGSGVSLVFGEYTDSGELVIKYSLFGQTNEMTRCEKYNFKNMWFGTLKSYNNFEKKN